MNEANDFRVGDIVRLEGKITALPDPVGSGFYLDDGTYRSSVGFVVIVRPEPTVTVELTESQVRYLERLAHGEAQREASDYVDGSWSVLSEALDTLDTYPDPF